MRSRSSRRGDADSRRTSLSEVSEDSEAVSESAEDVIFALFGPRVWEHQGEWMLVLRVLKFVFTLQGKTWMRRVSTDPASRYDVLYLTER